MNNTNKKQKSKNKTKILLSPDNELFSAPLCIFVVSVKKHGIN